MARQKLSPRTIATRAKEGRAVQLRLAGSTFEEIATQVGYINRGGAYKAVKRAIERMAPVQEAGELRQLEFWRLERMLKGLWARATSATSNLDNLKVVDRVLGILQQQRRLMGLDMPVQIEMETRGELEIIDERGISELVELADKIESLKVEDLEFLDRASGDLDASAREE